MGPLDLFLIVVFASWTRAEVPGSLVLNVPQTLTQCASVKLTWNDDGGAPYILAIFSDQSPSVQRSSTFDTFFDWNTDVPAGSVVTFILEDDLGFSYTADRITFGNRFNFDRAFRCNQDFISDTSKAF
ncbi:hypothetical protein BN946_scf184787.g23 [Trametes cinnabarina]|uniref:Uncharacterized protein n=1 Tax=Pycnoporus cinnabarinus TaxID=5643 RepID=A0A060SYR2_PYCCI|nr:hypothetical protein BN946_scf184787.g23 [Trametes cinnabarina]